MCDLVPIRCRRYNCRAWLLTAKIGHILRQIVEFDRIRRERARLTWRHFDKCGLLFLAVALNKFMLAIRHCDLNGRRGGVRMPCRALSMGRFERHTSGPSPACPDQRPSQVEYVNAQVMRHRDSIDSKHWKALVKGARAGTNGVS